MIYQSAEIVTLQDIIGRGALLKVKMNRVISFGTFKREFELVGEPLFAITFYVIDELPIFLLQLF